MPHNGEPGVRGLWKTERELRGQGFAHIAGVDEAGCGPIAGPVVAAAVIFAGSCRLPGLADSKLLKPEDRGRLYNLIRRKAISVGVGIADVRMIDRVNILRAAHFAMETAISQLAPAPDLLLVDGRGLPAPPFPQRAVIGGDRKCASIAAASIIAKVTRDCLMTELDQMYPSFGFDRHKGYATREHLDRLAEFGPCPEHRRSFAPVRNLAQGRLAFGDADHGAA
ncbi:MAG: ribonuclease HII [Armatimonadetes bacterium]|nr:ribonuclease HII [Armatimonadota bacterium]